MGLGHTKPHAQGVWAGKHAQGVVSTLPVFTIGFVPACLMATVYVHKFITGQGRTAYYPAGVSDVETQAHLCPVLSGYQRAWEALMKEAFS